MPPTPPPPTPTPRPPPLDAFSREVFPETNAARTSAGVPVLALSAPLTRAAKDYAAVLAKNNWFDHTGPDGSTLASRTADAGYSGGWLGEVLYMGPTSGSPADIVNAWLNSPSHRSILLGPQFTEIGVGCAVSGETRWCVEVLGGPA